VHCKNGRLVVYVTSHGFGHLARAVATINHVPPSVPVTIRSHPNLFGAWRDRLRREAQLEPHVSDAGAVNPPGDSAATDGRATLELAERVHGEAMARIEEEVSWLRASSAAAVLSDVPPVPLVAATRAGIPAYLQANFTWAQIYAPHARRLGGQWPKFVADLRRAYRQATALFLAQPALHLDGFTRTIDVGMIVTPGRDRRMELGRCLGVAPSEKVVYVYVGRYGQTGLAWERLGCMKGVHFVGFHAPPVGGLPNVHVVPTAEWTGAELAASADAMVAKAGYGTTCDAMVSGTPLIYPPRTGFSEHRVLDRALRVWGGGVPVSSRAFAELRLERFLARAFALRPGPPPYPVDGARRVADYLASICRGKRRP
jgi:hypothetical protein